MIYLDHNATTSIAPEVLEAMMPYFATDWGNPSSSYRFSSKLKPAIETAREQVAELINAMPQEIIFTSCATESNNTAIHAALRASPNKRHVVTSVVEHSSVLNYCKMLERDGYQVTYLPVDRNGLLSLSNLKNAITEKTAVVSLMWANNETGVLFPVKKIGELCRSCGVLFHCDAVQAAGKTSIDLGVIGADYLSISGHKMGAPKGIGALYVRRKTPFVPLIYGGDQEQARRGGTENMPYIVALGMAASLALEKLPEYEQNVRPLRDMFEQGILRGVNNAELNGHSVQRLSNTISVRLSGMDNSAVLMLLDQAGICASSGAACMGSAITPSHVISAMTNSHRHAGESLRFSLGIVNTANDVKTTIERIKEIIALLL